MKKTKLEIIRINEDVIATSAGPHYIAKHYYILELNDDKDKWKYSLYEWKNGKLDYTGPGEINKSSLPDGDQAGKWFIAKTGVWTECTESTHPKFD